MTDQSCAGCAALAIRVTTLEREHADLAQTAGEIIIRNQCNNWPVQEAVLALAVPLANRPDLIAAIINLGKFAQWFMQTRKYIAAIFSALGIALAFLTGVLTGASAFIRRRGKLRKEKHDDHYPSKHGLCARPA